MKAIVVGLLGSLAACGQSSPQVSTTQSPSKDFALRSTQNMDDWSRNYERLVDRLKAASNVGDCAISLSQASGAPIGSWTINILHRPEGLLTFEINPPQATNGRTQVDKLPSNILRYRQSDIVGWINFIARLDSVASTVTGIEVNKTLPNGTIYERGVICGGATE